MNAERSDRAAAVNICFHGIGQPRFEREPGESQYWIDRDAFVSILDNLAARPRVQISFDDGNRSDIDVALAELVARDLTAWFFPIASRLDDPDSLSPAALQELHSAGMQIGSHGMWHRPWRRMTPELSDQELRQAREILATAVEQPITDAAMPLGQYDRRSLRDLRRQHYSRVLSSDRRLAHPGRWLQPRFSVRAGETVERLDASIRYAGRPVNRAKLAAVGVIKRLR